MSKLEWFRLGDETSERQWDDVKKVVAVLGESLDIKHMRRMDEEKVSGLFCRRGRRAGPTCLVEKIPVR